VRGAHVQAQERRHTPPFQARPQLGERMLAFAADQDRLAASEPLGSERLAGAASARRLGWSLRLAGVVIGRGRRGLVGGPSRLALVSSLLAAIRVVARRWMRTGSRVFGQTRVLRPRQRQKLARRRQQILMRQRREVRRRQGLQIVRESVRPSASSTPSWCANSSRPSPATPE
jgi:hypothetical protein